MGSTPVECTTLNPLKTSGLHRKIERKSEPVLLGNYCRFLSKNTAFCVFTGTLLALDLILFAPVLCGLRVVQAFERVPNSPKKFWAVIRMTTVSTPPSASTPDPLATLANGRAPPRGSRLPAPGPQSPPGCQRFSGCG